MKAIFVRAKDGQVVMKLQQPDDNEALLLAEWTEQAGQRAWVEVQGDLSVLLYPKQPG